MEFKTELNDNKICLMARLEISSVVNFVVTSGAIIIIFQLTKHKGALANQRTMLGILFLYSFI